MNCHLSEITELKYMSLIKMIILEENLKWHLEAFASELFIWYKCSNRDVSLQVLSTHAELMNSLVHNTSINEQDKTPTSHLLLIIQISNVRIN